MWIGFILQTLLVVIPINSLSESVRTSKACYGAQGNHCTRHTLVCRRGKIVIQDAYYTNSGACDAGLSNCNMINVSSIPDTGKNRDFNETQLNTLCKDCSIKPRCTFNGGRAPNLISFSVVKYMCISDPDGSSQKCSKSSTTDSKGAVAGGVVAALVVIGVVVAFVLWFKFKRNKEPRVKSDKPNDNYCVVTPGSTNTSNAYFTEVTTKSRSNYDYATVQDDITSKGHVTIDNYDLATIPVEKRIIQNRDASRMDEDDYNHINDQNKTISSGDKTTGYDTSASATAAVRRLQIKKSLYKEGDYDYNHLCDNSDVKPIRSDYDTAESASRTVAQMVRNKDTAEDDYDHFHKKEAKLSDSPYNTTEQCVNETDYSLARSVDKKDPYDRAK